jgi:hypothetical protein
LGATLASACSFSNVAAAPTPAQLGDIGRDPPSFVGVGHTHKNLDVTSSLFWVNHITRAMRATKMLTVARPITATTSHSIRRISCRIWRSRRSLSLSFSLSHRTAACRRGSSHPLVVVTLRLTASRPHSSKSRRQLSSCSSGMVKTADRLARRGIREHT